MPTDTTTTLFPTYETGARTATSTVVYATPERSVRAVDLAGGLAGSGVNGPFVVDLLSAVLAHERCGRHLYRSVAGRTRNPVLQERYEEFGRETERHVDVMVEIITLLGGDPGYVSPMARATEATDTRILESTFLLAGSIDLMTAEMVMLDAVVLAETVDHANWVAMQALGEQLPAGSPKEELRPLVQSVLDDEEEHLGWATEMRHRMIQLRATAPVEAAGSDDALADRIATLLD